MVKSVFGVSIGWTHNSDPCGVRISSGLRGSKAGSGQHILTSETSHDGKICVQFRMDVA